MDCSLRDVVVKANVGSLSGLVGIVFQSDPIGDNELILHRYLCISLYCKALIAILMVC